jgi:hypothetical protein
LYDVADAWLANKPITTTPFIANPQAAAAAQTPVASPAVTVPQPITLVPPRTDPTGVATSVPGFTVLDPTGFNGQPLYIRTADGNTIGLIPTYAFVQGQLVPVGTFNNQAVNVQPPPSPPVMYQPPPTGGAGGPGQLIPTAAPQPPQTPATLATAGVGWLLPLLAAGALFYGTKGQS